MSSKPSKAVRFAPAVKRRRDEAEDDVGETSRSSSNVQDHADSFSGKRQKRSRPNEDELDDIDEWRKEDDEEEAELESSVPSERELLEMKRKRRQKRGDSIDADGGTHIDKTTSLAEEGIAIEPFHMEQERTDGSGYFDGDTYVFRNRAADEEPDAWLDSLDKDEGDDSRESKNVARKPLKTHKENSAQQSVASMDDLTKEELYSKILPLVSDTETVAQAVRRFGQLIKRKDVKKNGKSQKSESTGSEGNHDFAKDCLDELTGAANALLFKGDVGIYDTTRNDILKILPQHQQQQASLPGKTEKKAKNLPAQWEYMGNQDGKLHGPFTTQQMIDWTQAGYFVGTQQVKIRTIREGKLSTKDELLADLDDSDDEEKERQVKNLVKGEWMSSDDVDFKSYL